MRKPRTLTPTLLVLMLSAGLVVGFPRASNPRTVEADRGAYHVFGDPLPGLSENERTQFEQGYQLFIHVWNRNYVQRRSLNSLTCVGCHMEPMPGGSGTAARTFVAIAIQTSDVAGGHVFGKLLANSEGEKVQPLPAEYSLRRTPPLFGMGLLEAVTDRVPAVDGKVAFGWRGNTKTLSEFVEKAIAVELGLDTPHFHHAAEIEIPVRRSTLDQQEVSAEQIQLITQFIRLLGPPRPKNANYMRLPGFETFEKLGCSDCHTPVLRTGESNVEALRHQTIFPFTDLRTHDMGPELSDCQDETPPNCSRFRTPPLWGLSSTGPPFLHDGRAHTLEEALFIHGGEATQARVDYEKLSREDKELLLDFLNAL